MQNKVSISSDYNLAIIENCIDAIEQLRKKELDVDPMLVFKEHEHLLKVTCKRLHLPVRVIDVQEKRLSLYQDHYVMLYLLFKHSLPKLASVNLDLNEQECAQYLKPLFDRSDYKLQKDHDHFYLYDEHNHKDVKSLEDFNHTVFLEDDLNNFENIFLKELAG